MEAPIRVLDNVDQIHMVSSLECQTDVVDSISPPLAAEYISTKHALARDCDTLRLIENNIKECQLRIERAHAELRILECQRDGVQRRVSIHRARLSPLRTVPDQILQEIFQHCLPDTPYVVPNTRSAPLVLTHVCRRWRIVVQASPELWSSIALRDRGVWNYELEVEMVKRWLDRSRARLIRMSITCPPCTDFGLDGHVSCSDIFQLAVAHSAQLSNVRLNVNRTYLHYFLEHASLPVLRSINIVLHSVHRTGESLDFDTPTISAPNLKVVTFKGREAINVIPRILFVHITHLSLDCDMSLDLALLFQNVPHLQHLSLTLALFPAALRLHTLPRHDHRRIAVASLHTLEICLDKDMLDFGDPLTLESLLDQLELPALHTLTITAPTERGEVRWENHDAWVRVASVASLLSRSRHGARLVCSYGTCPSES